LENSKISIAPPPRRKTVSNAPASAEPPAGRSRRNEDEPEVIVSAVKKGKKKAVPTKSPIPSPSVSDSEKPDVPTTPPRQANHGKSFLLS